MNTENSLAGLEHAVAQAVLQAFAGLEGAHRHLRVLYRLAAGAHNFGCRALGGQRHWAGAGQQATSEQDDQAG